MGVDRFYTKWGWCLSFVERVRGKLFRVAWIRLFLFIIGFSPLMANGALQGVRAQNPGDNSPAPVPTHLCDTLAASTNDPRRVVTGVSRQVFLKVGGEYKKEAIDACRAAVMHYPNEARFQYQYARVLWASEPHSALVWIRKAAEQGYEIAEDTLGQYFRIREGNHTQAVEWFKRAASNGLPIAQFHLGEMYRRGRGVPRADQRIAMEWYQRAADRGYARAQIHLGDVYRRGDGASRADYVQARNWYIRAAKQGEARAQNKLGYLYHNGFGVAKSERKAITWYARAAGQGFVMAEKNLAGLLKTQPRLMDLARRERQQSLAGLLRVIARTEKQLLGAKQKPLGEEAQSSIIHRSELELWQDIQNTDDPEQYRAYLLRYPEGQFVVLARRQLKSLQGEVPQASLGVAEPSPSLKYGRYVALVIGNNSYQFLESLKTAEDDARAVAALLTRDYGFETQLLTNATRSQILHAFDNLREKLSSDDNLLIYYGGHGWLDQEMGEGFWLPTDADETYQDRWISDETIRRYVKAYAAKHVLVIADSCFSGSLVRPINRILTRGIRVKRKNQLNEKKLKKLLRKKVRIAMTSGGLEPVSDGGGDGHSVFARALLNGLTQNKGVIKSERLFVQIHQQVQLEVAQRPNRAAIDGAGHDDDGDFMFVRRF